MASRFAPYNLTQNFSWGGSAVDRLHSTFVVGYGSHAQRHWGTDQTEEAVQWIGAKVALSEPLFVRDGQTVHKVVVGTLRVQPGHPTNTASTSRLQSSIGVRCDGYTDVPEADWSVSVSQETFESLLSELDASPRIEVRGYVRGTSSFEPWVSDGKQAYSEVALPELRTSAGSYPTPAWVHDIFADHLRAQLGSICFDKGSQFGWVVTEICKSLAKLPEPDQAKRLAQARDMLQHLRAAFREPMMVDGYNVWAENVGNFDVSLKNYDEAKQKDLRRKYDTLWTPFSVVAAVRRGERAAGSLSQGFQPAVDELESLARELRAMPEVVSPTLEWALMSALVYAESIAFAQSFLGEQKLKPLAIRGELPGTAVGPWWKDFTERGPRAVGSVLLELGLLVGTIVAAAILAQGNVLAMWTIAVGVSATRWIRSAILKKPSPRARATELLVKMSEVNDRLRTDFNPRVVRSMLDAARTEGAVFSPWVYNLLDAQIERARLATAR
jgi:hypothetical protein